MVLLHNNKTLTNSKVVNINYIQLPILCSLTHGKCFWIGLLKWSFPRLERWLKSQQHLISLQRIWVWLCPLSSLIQIHCEFMSLSVAVVSSGGLLPIRRGCVFHLHGHRAKDKRMSVELNLSVSHGAQSSALFLSRQEKKPEWATAVLELLPPVDLALPQLWSKAGSL